MDNREVHRSGCDTEPARAQPTSIVPRRNAIGPYLSIGNPPKGTAAKWQRRPASDPSHPATPEPRRLCHTSHWLSGGTPLPLSNGIMCRHLLLAYRRQAKSLPHQRTCSSKNPRPAPVSHQIMGVAALPGDVGWKQHRLSGVGLGHRPERCSSASVAVPGMWGWDQHGRPPGSKTGAREQFFLGLLGDIIKES